MYVEEYLPMIGKSGPRARQEVGAEAIRRFAEAIGDSNPIYSDPEYAAGTPYGRVIAPPTFCFTLRYPPIPGVWIAPAGRIHARQSFEYRRPLYAGEIVECSQCLSKAYEKQGKNGWMVFLEHERTAYDLEGNVICVNRLLTITRGSLFEARGQGPAPAGGAEPAFIKPGPVRLTAGQTLPAVTLPPVTRMDIAKYAGAAWDYNAIHLQDEAARKVGFPSVIAHGMLSAALLGRVAEGWAGPAWQFAGIDLRLSKPVLPGEALTFTGTVAALEPDGLALEFAASKPDGDTVIQGSIQMRPL